MSGNIYIGTSGWSYQHWRQGFYAGVPQKAWLAHCASHFSSIEVNATFYRLQTRNTFERWRASTPESFRFAIKGNRFLTHCKKLAKPRSSIEMERERACALGDKLAAVLWQLPAEFRNDIKRLYDFVEALKVWPQVRHCVELREKSWFTDEVADCLSDHNVAVCLSDAADWPIWDRITSNLVYIRLHGHTRTYVSSYSMESLKKWSTRMRFWSQQGRDVHVYFNNDSEGAAPFNAMQLLELVKSGNCTRSV